MDGVVVEQKHLCKCEQQQQQKKRSRIIRQAGAVNTSYMYRVSPVLGTFDGDDVLFSELQHRMCHSIIRWMFVCVFFFLLLPLYFFNLVSSARTLHNCANRVLRKVQKKHNDHLDVARWFFFFSTSFLFSFCFYEYVQICERYMGQHGPSPTKLEHRFDVTGRRHSCKCTRLCSICCWT